jgi:acyl dehydratase
VPAPVIASGATRAYPGQMLTINGLSALRDHVGEDLGTSAWHEVTQAHIDAFASATDDHTRIHVDPQHASKTPFGTTIAHGLYTLSLGPKFLHELFEMHDVGLGLNYGFNRVRFITPVRCGSRVRMRARLVSVEDVERLPGEQFSEGIQAIVEQTFEIDGYERPACVAESLVMYFA